MALALHKKLIVIARRAFAARREAGLSPATHLAAKPRRAAYGIEEVTRMVQSHFPSDIFIDFLNWQEYMLLPRILCC